MKINRREFTAALGSVAALTAAGEERALAGQGEPGRKLRYCMVGLGRISMKHFMPGCKESKLSQVTALVSGDRKKAEEQAALYGVPAKNIYDYKNYDEIKNNRDIDAVYIALPNSMHAEYTIRAARAGKHVLCEKPMATTINDSLAMIDACRAANKRLMIAYRCHFEPTNSRAMQLIRDGKLGKIQAIESANGFNVSPGEWRLNRKLAGGGPLMDVGVYSLNACRFLTGEEPAHIEAYSSVIDKDGRFNEVEENLSWTMSFPSGIVASCNTTYGASMSGFYRVHGSKGTLHVEPAFGYEGLHLKADLQGEGKTKQAIDEPNPAKDPSQFALEADHFAQCVFENREPKTNGQEGLRDMQFMSKIYKSAGLRTL